MDAPGHSELAPSSADRWEPCPGSVALIRRLRATGDLVPEDKTDSADGQAAHWICSETLIHGTPPTADRDPDGTLITEEMHEGAALYVKECMWRAVSAGRDNMHVESHMPIPDVHAVAHGTPDCWIWNARERLLTVLDFKFGYRWVELTTLQLIMYLSGALSLMGVDRRNCHGITLEIVIVQPRSYRREGPVRAVRFPAEDLWPQVDRIRAAAIRAMGPEPECRTGEWCRDCPARNNCGTINRAVSNAIEVVTGLEPDVLSPADLGRQFELLEQIQGLLKARLSGQRGTIEAMLASGKIVPGWMFDSVDGNLKWNDDITDAQIEAMGKMYGKQTTKSKPITPTQAIAAGVPAATVAAYASRPKANVLTNKSQLSQRAAQEFGK